ncbi:serine protease [Rhodococcus sp. D2-41]|uniref:S1C family serine protease n=1 Tax=Speluncibacter jeojiensis TaxID=2710754 RepID=UPI00240EB386|nr:S1C family serine protease [Rhodococcus sp. D2-41]MDG3010866.1 serine protease [Rhodococcus sp. D2-41]
MAHTAFPAVETIAVALLTVGASALVPPAAGAAPSEVGPCTPMPATCAGVVDIDTVLGYQGERAAGTGMVRSANGDVVTNNHVVEGATAISVTDVGNGRSYRARVLGWDRVHDVAALRLEDAAALATVPVGDSSLVTVGEPIVGVGNAEGAGGTPSVAPGVVTALDQAVSAQDEGSGSVENLTGLIEIDADIQPGDSGGPLVDRFGRAVGMDTAASESLSLLPPGRQAFAIPINEVMGIAGQIESGAGAPTVHLGETAFLGVGMATGGAPSAQGVAVREVVAGSPAARAGVRVGDVLTAIDGRRVDSAATVVRSLDGHHPGDRISLGWMPVSGAARSAQVQLVAGPVG